MGKVTHWVSIGVLGLLSFSLTACQKGPPWKPPPPIVESMPLPGLPQLSSADDIDDYKALVAAQIMQANPDSTFSGKLPPMLPAIVVVNISVDVRGELTRVTVQRSRDSAASTVALSAVKQSGPFPMPLHLLLRGHKTLDFSETFLFGDRYRFKLRSLAGPQ